MVSVIVPVYNVAKYLIECLYSLANQNFRDYEVLLVDDGSTDNSSAICMDFVSNNDKFKYFKKQNGGLSSARNFGIEKASGEWLMFVDSDDVVSHNYISTLYNVAINSNCKLAVCKYKKFEKSFHIDSETAIFKVTSKKEYLLQMFEANFMAAWNKIYHMSLFENIRYPEGLIHEDFGTTFKVVDLVENIAITDAILYYYRHNPNSITLSKIKSNKIDILRIYKIQVDYFKERKKVKYYNSLYKKTSNQFFSCFGTLLSYKKEHYYDFDAFKNDVSSFYKSNYNYIKQLPLSFTNRIIFIFSFKRVLFLMVVALFKKGLFHGT